jgi:hypothetical protein
MPDFTQYIFDLFDLILLIAREVDRLFFMLLNFLRPYWQYIVLVGVAMILIMYFGYYVRR